MNSTSAVIRGTAGMAVVGSSVAVSRTLTDAPLATAQAVRYVLAAGLLVALARGAGVPVVRPRGREWLWLLGVAGAGLVVFNVAVVRGVAHAEPAVIAVAVACVPVLLGVLGPLLQRQRPGARIVLAAVVVTGGAVLVEGSGRADALGVAWAAVALACEAGFTLLAVPVLPRHGGWGVSVHSVWIGAVLFVGCGVVADGPTAALRLSAQQWLAIAWLTIMVTAVAFVWWYSAVAELGPARAGLLTGVAPISAAVVGLATGARAPGALVWAGMVIVVLGLLAGLRGRRATRRRPVAVAVA